MGRCKRRQYNPALRRATIENDYYCALLQGPVNVVCLTCGKIVSFVGLSACYKVLDVIQAAGFDFSDRSSDYRFMWVSSFPPLFKRTYRRKHSRQYVSEEFLEGRLSSLSEGLRYE